MHSSSFVHSSTCVAAWRRGYLEQKVYEIAEDLEENEEVRILSTCCDVVRCAAFAPRLDQFVSSARNSKIFQSNSSPFCFSR